MCANTCILSDIMAVSQGFPGVPLGLVQWDTRIWIQAKSHTQVRFTRPEGVLVRFHCSGFCFYMYYFLLFVHPRGEVPTADRKFKCRILAERGQKHGPLIYITTHVVRSQQLIESSNVEYWLKEDKNMVHLSTSALSTTFIFCFILPKLAQLCLWNDSDTECHWRSPDFSFSTTMVDIFCFE